MSIVNVSIGNILDPEVAYEKFANKYVACTFRIDETCELLGINQTLESEIYDFTDDENAIIENENDSSNPIYNWNYLSIYNPTKSDPYQSVYWKIPTTGNSKHLGKFIFGGYTYYTIFGLFNSAGNIVQTSVLGKQLELSFNILSGTLIRLYQVKIEALPININVTVPCNTVWTYYNNGIVEIETI